MVADVTRRFRSLKFAVRIIRLQVDEKIHVTFKQKLQYHKLNSLDLNDQKFANFLAT